MMRYLLLICTAAIFASCGDGNFINHTLEYKKLGSCSAGEKMINMQSNIAGERYDFEACIDSDFDGKNYKVERTGDSILVSFPKGGPEQSAFKITLDIDAKPVYHHIFLDGKEVIVGQQQLMDVK